MFRCRIDFRIFVKLFNFYTFTEVEPEVLPFFTNFNLTDISTPIDADRFAALLIASGYDRGKTEFVVQGFKRGFHLCYEGPLDRRDEAQNLPFSVGNKIILWEKIMNEIKLGRFAGPYAETPPFDNYVQSPVGLVPKSGGKTRLIFHLSYKFKNGNRSVNAYTPEHLCTVHYNDLDSAVRNCLHLDEINKPEAIYLAKTDLMSAFRALPLSKESLPWVVMAVNHPISNKKYYLVDKNLPFGHSISCSLFQMVSDALKHVVEWAIGETCVVTNYLDDFLFIGISRNQCNHRVRTFLAICEQINFPVALDKTEFATTSLTFLGIGLNGDSRTLSVPEDKRLKALNLIRWFMARKKATVKEIQRLAGFLNFLNKAVVPGRVFMRRMYAKYSDIAKGKTPLKPHHHVSLDAEFRNDCEIWELFLSTKLQEVVNRPFMDLSPKLIAKEVDVYSDASKNPLLGLGCYYAGQWTFAQWEPQYIQKFDPSIEYLELLALVVGTYVWADDFRNARVIVHCDNQSVVDIIQDQASKCKNCMYLLRLMTLNSLRRNVRIFSVHVRGKDNGLSDSLSRLDFRRFFRNAPANVDRFPQEIPEELSPFSKLWQY